MIWNYSLGLWLKRPGVLPFYKNLILAFGVGGNLTLLGVFKYLGFFSLTINGLTGSEFPVLAMSVPLGVSFFSFQQIAYLVDIWRASTKEGSPNFPHTWQEYACFVTFFPQLNLGPIVLARDFFYQIRRKRFLRWGSIGFSIGASFFAVGLFKKVVIADRMAVFADAVFNSPLPPGEMNAIDIWMGVIAYSLQIYFDFSGYSDMAVGLGRMMGVKVPFNFNSPYQASSVIDFWRSWHMTLSGFLRDYLYIPLGGNRKGEILRVRNIMITMLLGGLWHGAGSTFIVWGGLHGVFLVVNHFWRKLGVSFPNWLGVVITFLCVTLAWVFFRATSISQAMAILTAMVNPGLNLTTSLWAQSLVGTSLFVLGLIVALAFKNSQQFSLSYYRNPLVPAGMAVVFIASILKISTVERFIYVQF